MNTRFGIGKVLGAGFRIWLRNFVPFLVLMALVHSPLLIWGVVLAQRYVGYEHLERVAEFWRVSLFVVPLLNMLASAVLTYGVVMELQGQRVSIYACVTTGFTRFFPALGTMMFAVLCIFGAFLCGALALAIGGEAGILLGGSLAAAYAYGTVAVAVQASVIDRSSVLGALRRSRALTRGHRFAMVVLLILQLALGFALLLAVGFMGWGFKSLIVLDLFVRGVLVGALSATMASVAYYFLRAEKEGTSAAELAAVFD